MPICSQLLPVLTTNAIRRGAVCLALALSIVTLTYPGRAAVISNVRGPTAEAFFDSTDPTGCIETDVFVFASGGKQHDPPGPPTASSTAFVNVTQIDLCARRILIAASGLATLPEAALQLDREVTSATLNATVQVTDDITGNTSDVEVALTWSGTGELVRESERFYRHSPGSNFQSRFKGSFRDAQASGSISLGGVNLTPQPSGFAVIGSVKQGSVTIE